MRDQLCAHLHDSIHLFHFRRWQSHTAQRLLVDCFSNSALSNKFLQGYYLSLQLKKFVIRGRNNNLQLNYRAFRVIKGLELNCRRCHKHIETQAHVSNHCSSLIYDATHKHYIILSILSSYLFGLGFEVHTDLRPEEVGNSPSPDLIIRDYRFLLDL